MLSLDLLSRHELDSYYDDVGRMYKTPAGVFPSVTTVIGQAVDKSHLEEWRDRIGHIQADLETERAARYGSKLHDVLEKYLLNEDYSQAHPIEKMRFDSVKRKIAPNIDKVFGAEFPLYSAKLRTAGRADGVISWNGVPAILDLKTTKKWKREDWILHYFIQAATYGWMTNDSYHLNINKIIIVFSTQDMDCFYYEKDISQYIDQVRKVFIENR